MRWAREAESWWEANPVDELEVAALEAASWITKTALSLWWDDQRIHPAADLADALSPHVVSVIERRRLTREFDAVTDHVAVALIERGLTGVALSNALAVLHEVRINAATVERWREDPSGMARFVRDCVPGGQTAEEQVVRLLCAALLAVLEALPRRAEGLQDLSRISAHVTEVIRRLPRFDQLNSHEEFTEAYCSFLAESLDRAEPAYALAAAGLARRYRLTSACLRPAVLIHDERGIGKTHRFDKTLATAQRLLIRGEAGAGKSTLLSLLAIWAAKNEPLVTTDTRPVPFLLRLRTCADGELPEPNRFLELGAPHLATAAPVGWVHRTLTEGAAVVLVDGLDEIPTRRRKEAVAWLRELLARFPRIRCVVTSRFFASASIGDTFTIADLAPLSKQDVRLFVHKWYNAVAREETGPEDRESSLLRALERSHHLRQLGSSPQMCALLCALNASRPGPLPRDQDIYESVLDLLLSRSGERAGPGNHLGYRETVTLLEQIAFWFLMEDRDEADAKAVLAQLRRALLSMPQVTDSPEGALDYLVQHSGVLRESAPGRIDFTHRTLRDYLTARALVRNDATELLGRLAHLEQWRAVAELVDEQLPLGRRNHDNAAKIPLSGSERHLILAVDVDAFNAPTRSTSHQMDVRNGLYGVLRATAEQCGVSWEDCPVEDTGDGLSIRISSTSAFGKVVNELPVLLAENLRRHNAHRSGSARLRLRMAIHIGTAGAGHDGITAFRLLDSTDLRESLRAANADLAVIVSPQIFDEFVEDRIQERLFRCRVLAKETSTEAWLWLPGTTRPAPESIAGKSWNGPAGKLGSRIKRAHDDLADRQALVSIGELTARAERARPPLNALATLREPGVGVIPAITTATRLLARDYVEVGACAISVLTEDLARVRAEVDVPLVHNDLVLGPYHVYEARAGGADLVVLAVEALEQSDLAALLGLVELLGMTAIVQVRTPGETDRALEAGAQVVGITINDPRTSETDEDTFTRLAPLVPMDVVKIAMSEVVDPADILRYAEAGADAVLVGETPDADGDPVVALYELVEAGARRWSDPRR